MEKYSALKDFRRASWRVVLLAISFCLFSGHAFAQEPDLIGNAQQQNEDAFRVFSDFAALIRHRDERRTAHPLSPR